MKALDDDREPLIRAKPHILGNFPTSQVAIYRLAPETANIYKSMSQQFKRRDLVISQMWAFDEPYCGSFLLDRSTINLLRTRQSHTLMYEKVMNNPELSLKMIF